MIPSLRRQFFDRAEQRLPTGMRPSPFTNRTEWLGQGALSFAMMNFFPSTRGHTMVLPRDFAVYRFFELAEDELAEHHRFAKLLRREFNKHFKPDGYNIGWNIEFAGGQSIAHAHMHIMPRYHAVNDTHAINPKGGVARMPFPQIPAFYNGLDQKDDAAYVEFMRHDAPVIAENDKAFAVQLTRSHAMTPGHSWIFTKTPRKDVLRGTEKEFVAQLKLALDVMNIQQMGGNAPSGYNIGWDVGAAAGQVGEYSALQVVPRYDGDMDSPRGGIVRIIPQDAWPQQTDYYDKKNVGKDVKPQDSVTFPFTFWDSPARENVLDIKKELSLR